MKFEKLQPDLVVYDVGHHKMGNTSLTTVGVWDVRIVSVDADSRSCMASWNGNPPKRFYEHSIRKWRANRPLLIESGYGGRRRLATREEVAAHKAKAGT